MVRAAVLAILGGISNLSTWRRSAAEPKFCSCYFLARLESPPAKIFIGHPLDLLSETRRAIAGTLILKSLSS